MVDIKSSKQLAEAIAELANNPGRASEMGSRARDHVTSRYGIDSAISKLTGMYEQLSAGRSRSQEIVGIG